MKLKILGMALLALAATSAFAAMNASAVVPAGSHFTHDGAGGKAIITAHEAKGTSHQLKFFHLKSGTHETEGKAIECEKATYEGTVNAATVQSITLFPTYTNCNTEGDAAGSVTVTPNECGYTFFSHGANTHGTVEVVCPPGKAIVIKHPQCEITIPGQTTKETLTEGITYDTVVENSKHALTATVTVKTITGYYHNGLCVFLGTNQKFEMIGSVTVAGYEDEIGPDGKPKEGARVSITHT